MLGLSILLLWIAQAPRIDLEIQAPPELAAEKSRMASLDRDNLEGVLRLVGLKDAGPPILVVLAPGGSDLARAVDPWIAGFATRDNVVIFPSRSPGYPHNTLEDVLRHEVAHALIWRASAGRSIPRWFNEGLATAAERRRGFQDQTQLLLHLVSGSRLSFDQINRLFDGGQADRTRAYLLSGALVWDLLSKHGESAGGRILERVGKGASFEAAFANVIGQSPAAAEADFWNRQRVWTTWIPILFSQETLWLGITLLAILAIWRIRKRNAAIRKRWEEEEASEQRSLQRDERDREVD
jgi:hypothetical protein